MTAVPLAALTLAFEGMAGLALAMGRHHEQVTGRSEVPRTQRLLLRWVGILLLTLALLACTVAWGATVGFTAWWGFLTAGGLLVGVLLTYAPHLVVRASAAALLVLGMCLAWAAGGWQEPAARFFWGG